MSILTTALLDRDQCADVAARVRAHEPRWTRRSTSEFFTLGAASYLDDETAYMPRAAATNPLLDGDFGDLHERLRTVLAERLDAPCSLASPFARPGFHIWRVPGIPTTAEASLHFDMQYERVPFPERARTGFDRPISFTLPLVLPRQGGGLTTWDVTVDQVNAFYRRTGYLVTLDDLKLLLTPRHHAYEVGTLVLHSGHMLHQIAPVPAVDPDDERITLQGHGIFYDGEWKLYW
jgi:hypothetical protein